MQIMVAWSLPDSCGRENPKNQIRNPKEIRSPKSQIRNSCEGTLTRRNATVQRLIARSDFGLPSDFDIRISDLRRTPRYHLVVPM